MAMDPLGRFLFVSEEGSSLVYVNGLNATGQLVSRTQYPVPIGQAPTSLSVDPTGRFLYAAIPTVNRIEVLSIDPVYGALAAVGNIAATNPTKIAMDAYGTHLAAIVDGAGPSSRVQSVLLHKSTGLETSSAISTDFLLTGAGIDLAFDPSGTMLSVLTREFISFFDVSMTSLTSRATVYYVFSPTTANSMVPVK